MIPARCQVVCYGERDLAPEVRSSMGKPPDDANRLDPLLESSFEASARALDSYLTLTASTRTMFSQYMGHILGLLNLPSESEVISVAERLTNIEMRLDDLDAKVEQIAENIEAIATAVVARPGGPELNRRGTAPKVGIGRNRSVRAARDGAAPPEAHAARKRVES